jgi:hypothetical protein
MPSTSNLSARPTDAGTLSTIDSGIEQKKHLHEALDELLRRVALFDLTGNTQFHMKCNQGGVTSYQLSLEDSRRTDSTRSLRVTADGIDPRWRKASHAALDEVLRRMREWRIAGKCSLQLHWNQAGLRSIHIITEEHFTVKGENKDASQ